MTEPQNLWRVGGIGLSLAGGMLAWSVTEYSSHRWVLHGPFGHGRLRRVPLGGLHRAHHRDPAATVLAARLTGHGAIIGVGVAASSALCRLFPAEFARAAAGAWTAGYATYELSHWAAHHRAPRSRWGMRLRRRHFRHHFGAPKANLGVTVSWWDDLLGTGAGDGIAPVPLRHAPEWMLANDRTIRADFRSDFAFVAGPTVAGSTVAGSTVDG